MSVVRPAMDHRQEQQLTASKNDRKFKLTPYKIYLTVIIEAYIRMKNGAKGMNPDSDPKTRRKSRVLPHAVLFFRGRYRKPKLELLRKNWYKSFERNLAQLKNCIPLKSDPNPNPHKRKDRSISHRDHSSQRSSLKERR